MKNQGENMIWMLLKATHAHSHPVLEVNNSWDICVSIWEVLPAQRSAASHMTRSRRHILLLIFSGWHYDLSNWLYPYMTSMLSSFYFLFFVSTLTYFIHTVVIPGFDCIMSTFTSPCGRAMSDCNSITKITLSARQQGGLYLHCCSNQEIYLY